MKGYKNLILAAAIACFGLSTKADIIINEVMQSNVYCIMDDIKEFPDSWVELYNTGDKSVNIRAYRIGLNKTFDTAYSLPAVSIPAHGHRLVYCDKAEQGLHTDFRIDSGKGDIYLFDSEGNEIDKISLKKQPAPDIAYGRETDGASKWGYQLTPTPGNPNEGGITSTVLSEVIFSVPGGVWKTNQNITLELQLPEKSPEGSYIVYTTDGAEPLTTSSTKTYTKALTINSGCVVRAKVVCEGCLSIPSNAQSYIFLGRAVKIPVISIAVNDKYLYDYNIGIFANGPGGVDHENYRYDWRRPINLEMFEVEGEASVLNQLCETRVQGGWTRGNKLKSMAVYANKRFGTKRFAYEFWTKDKPGITDNKSIVLRDGGNDFGWGYFRDALMQRVIGRNTNIDWQGYSPAIICINGKYHGMLAIRERSNEDNIEANYGLEDIDMFENWSELKAGTWDARNEFEEFIKSKHTFDEWAQVINIESFTNVMAINYWGYNTDFPHNNTVMWRRTDGVDGRWQWLIKDCDFAIGAWNSEENLNKSQHDFQMNNYAEPFTGYRLYHQLMQCEDFRQYYIDHLIAYTGDFMNKDTFNHYLNEIYQENYGEQQISHTKWGEWWSNFDNNINFMHNWINKRDKNISSLIKKDFKLGSAITVTLNSALTDDEAQALNLTYADVPLTRGRFSGNDYVGRTIRISAAETDNVVGWRVVIGQDTYDVEGKSLSIPIESVKKVTINAILGDAGVNDITVDKSLDIRQDGNLIIADGRIEVYDMSGRLVAVADGCVELPKRGAYIVRTASDQASKIVW